MTGGKGDRGRLRGMTVEKREKTAKKSAPPFE